MFKDKEDINHRNKKDYLKNIKLLSDAVQNDAPNYLNNFLLQGVESQEKLHNPNHKYCDYKKTDSNRITEKRICRCMYYFNSSKNEKCKNCLFSLKWKNESEYEIINYEVPMPKVVKKTGGIDLLLKSKNNNKIFATEVKPEYSTETLVRMIAEILTYCEISKYHLENYGKIIPSICFFKYSKQWEDYEIYKNNPHFKILMKKVQIFYITHTESSFDIHKLN